jgi:ABC-type sugar transport system permease subunit
MIILLYSAIGLFISIFLLLYYWKKPKVDKGFKFAYYGLSHRRKFWRTIYFIPFACLFIIIILYITGVTKVSVGLVGFYVILIIIQASYNYVKWQNEEQENA